MKKILTKAFVLPILIFMLAFSSFIAPHSFTKVYADDENPSKVLYYFSDDAHCSNYRARLLSGQIVDSCNLYNWSTYDHFEDAFSIYQQDINWTSITNAYVIFEMNKGFVGNLDMMANTVIFPNTLKYYFSMLKEQGCHIMFVCGTEEALFENCNSFLDYVDIHINTDIFNLLVYNVFMYAFDHIDMYHFEGVTFILDESFGGLDYIYNNWFFTLWLKPYLEYIYSEDLQLIGATWQLLCQYHNIKIIILTADGKYHDAFYPQNDLPSDDYQLYEYIFNPYMCAVGTSWQGAVQLSSWMSTIDELVANVDGDDISLFVYNQHRYQLESCSWVTTYVASIYNDYYDVIVDFLCDQDLTVYDNWDGRCNITYKSILFGPGGWMRCPYNLFTWWSIFGIRVPDPIEIPYV